MLIGERWNGYLKKHLEEKIWESLSSVLPITAIVLLLSISITPISSGTLVLFLFGALLLVLGMGMFTLGADLAMTPMGEGMGIELSKAKKSRYPIMIGLVFGIIITLAEPDLQVLAEQVPAIPNLVLILAVAAGIGVFMMIAIIRIIFKIPLNRMLIVFYTAIFLLICFAPASFIPVSFDSGGVTTGPITVPFIMALGVGLAALRSDKTSQEDSFGLVSLCSIGPILAVLMLGIFYKPETAVYEMTAVADITTTRLAAREFVRAFPAYLKEVAIAVLPIALMFVIFQAVTKRYKRRHVIRIISGLVYTYVGLVLFLTGVNVGFMPTGQFIGATIGASSVGIAMLRILTGISIMWFLVPGYLISLLLSFFVPKMYTGIAFDSGGVASGPMTATFLLPFAMGACNAVGGDILTDAFGIVAMVAMTPLITIQVLGLTSELKKHAIRRYYQNQLEQEEDVVLYFDSE